MSRPVPRDIPGPISVWALRIGVLIALGVGLAFRLNSGLARDLWEDEIIAATHATQSLFTLPIEVLRHDVHPFLYFLQLHFWSWAGTSDVWLRLNSVLWNLVAVASIAIVGTRLLGRTAGLTAAAILLLMPQTIWMAQELRPYSMLYVLLIWNFYLVQTAFTEQNGSRSAAVRCMVLSIIIAYTHAIGFFVVFLFGMQALALLAGRGLTRPALLRWLAVFGGVGVLSAPLIIVALSHDANLSEVKVFAAVTEWVPRMVLPRGDAPAALALAAMFYCLGAIVGACLQPLRAMALAFLLLPLVLAMALNILGLALFKLNIFSTVAAPFLALAIGYGLSRMRQLNWYFATMFCCVLLTFETSVWWSHRTPTTGFRDAAVLIRTEALPGDVVAVPQLSMFWGIAWYLVGPHWGSALAVAPKPNPAWQRIYAHLGPQIVGFLGLEPTTQTLMTRKGLKVLAGGQEPQSLVDAHRVWLVTYQRADLPAGFPPPVLPVAGHSDLTMSRATSVGLLRISLYQ